MQNFEISTLIPTILRFFHSVLYTIKRERIQQFNSINVLVSEILIFREILMCKFQNVPCPLGFEVKHSTYFSVEVLGIV